jgi:hypothetical protein
VLFGLFLFWVFRRLQAGHRLGRALAAMRDPLAARAPAAQLTAAIVGVMAANAFTDDAAVLLHALTMLALARWSSGSARLRIVVLTTSYPRHT